MTIKTKDYIALVRKITNLSDYKISKKYSINQSNLSKYNAGKTALSETHAWLFANILQLDPAKIVADTKLEQAKMNNNKDKIIFWKKQIERLNSNTKPLKINIAQINTTVGDLKGNTQKIIDFSLKAATTKTHLLIFPELVLTGYPAEDLLLNNSFLEQTNKQIKLICSQIPYDLTVIFGAPTFINNNLYNSAYLIQNNKTRIYNKQILPNYDVFDEKRYFKQGVDSLIFECQQKKIGIIICEDAWSKKPISMAANLGAQTIISINASPFQIGKFEQRVKIIKQRVMENNVDFIYVNAVGGQDELVFDGGSFVMNNNGVITKQLPFFKELMFDLDETYLKESSSTKKIVYDALVLATKDYIEKNNAFNGALVGLSGGIDSALTLAIVSDAIGVEKVQAVMMPYKYTSNISIEDAKKQAITMGVSYSEINISTIVDSFKPILKAFVTNINKSNVTLENLQARIRGTLLMAISNSTDKILITTSNKSEMAVGYATLYGDMSGGFAPLKDVNKTLVYKLANYRNSIDNIIPKRSIEREPSAELAYEQIDKDTLPPYDELDSILQLFVEQKQSVEQIQQHGFNKHTIKKIITMVLNSEHKRRQSPPGPKISAQAFGKGRRYPITSKFKP